MKTIIKVTQEDIDNGIYGSMCLCPVALACNRGLDWPKAAVSSGAVREHFYAEEYFKLPPKAMVFIQKFDYKEKVVPFEFELDI